MRPTAAREAEGGATRGDTAPRQGFSRLWSYFAGLCVRLPGLGLGMLRGKPLPAFLLVATAAALYSVVFLGGGVMLGLFLVHGGSLSEHCGLFLMHGGSVSEHPVQFPDERQWRYWRRAFLVPSRRRL